MNAENLAEQENEMTEYYEKWLEIHTEWPKSQNMWEIYKRAMELQRWMERNPKKENEKPAQRLAKNWREKKNG